MKPTPDLFNLVKSLNKNEKRYVTLFLNSGLYKNNKNSLQLFRAISRQEMFDEESLKKQLGKSFAKRFSAEKNQLFDLILESLMFLYRDAIPERKIVRNRFRSWLLFHKGLRPLGWKYFHKAQTQAEQYENFAQLALLAYQENHEMRLGSVNDPHYSSEKAHHRDKIVLDALNENLVLHTLFTEMIDVQKYVGQDIDTVTAHLERIMQHPLMDAKRKLNSFSSTTSRFEIRALYYSMQGNHKEAFACFGEVVSGIEKSQANLEQNYPRYCHALSNQLLHAAVMRDYEVMPALAQKRKKASDNLNYFSYDKELAEFMGIHLYEIIAWKNRADTNKGGAMLLQVEKEFAHYRPQLRDTFIIGMLFVLGAYHFYLGNLKKALHHFNDLVDSTDPEVGQNFQCMSRLVKLLLHYDLGHFDLLPSLVQSTTRMLQKKGHFGSFEKELLTFFKKPIEGEDRKGMEKLLPLIRKYAPGYYSYGAWCDFEFEAWVESHLKNKSFAQLIAAK